jgi:hypothetical protein
MQGSAMSLGGDGFGVSRPSGNRIGEAETKLRLKLQHGNRRLTLHPNACFTTPFGALFTMRKAIPA